MIETKSKSITNRSKIDDDDDDDDDRWKPSAAQRSAGAVQRSAAQCSAMQRSAGPESCKKGDES